MPTPLFDRLVEFFATIEWSVVPVPGEPILAATVVAPAGFEYTLVASTDEIARIISVFARPHFACPDEQRDELLRLLARVNFELNDGVWLLDPSDGELRFRTALQCGDEIPENERLRRLAGYAAVGLEKHAPILEQWLDNELVGEEAMQLMLN